MWPDVSDLLDFQEGADEDLQVEFVAGIDVGMDAVG